MRTLAAHIALFILFVFGESVGQTPTKIRWTLTGNQGSIVIVPDHQRGSSISPDDRGRTTSFIPVPSMGGGELRLLRTYGDRPIVRSMRKTVRASSQMDSTIIDDQDYAQVGDLPPITLGRPFWFRGQYLLPVMHSLEYVSNGITLEADSVTCSFGFTASEESELMRGSYPDRHFAPVFDEMTGAMPHSFTPLAWEDTTGRWFEGANKAIKLSYWLDGIYRVTQEELILHVPELSSLDPRGMRMWINGSEVPMTVSGEEDGTFDPGDYIEYPGFKNYGPGDYRRIPQGNEEYPEYLSRYGDTTIAWLTWGHPITRRIPTQALSMAESDTVSSYRELIHLERDITLQMIGGNLIVHQDPRWLPGDVWGWGWLGENGQFTADFPASEIDSHGDSVQLMCKLMSWGAQAVTPAHRLRMRLNNSDTLATLDLQQYQHGLFRAKAPIALLNSGSNTIRVHNIKTASSVNTIFVDWLEAEYSRMLRAPGDTLRFGFGDIGISTVRLVRIEGLSDTNLVLYKVRPDFRKITALEYSGSGPYTVAFRDSIATGDAYMISSVQRLRSPRVGAKNSFVNLRSTKNGADYLLLTTAPFKAVADDYAAFIGTTYGVRAAVVDVADIFDEFGSGQKTPESIREFFKATTRWTAPMPSYVLLAGDASYDFRFVSGNPDPTKRPINSIPSLGYPVSDPWLVALDDSVRIPQMYIGRIPINSAEEFQRYFNNHRRYVSTAVDGWNKRFLFFSGGDPANPSQIEAFKNVNNFVIQSYVTPRPVSGSASHFYKTVSPQSDFGPFPPEQVQRAIAEGGVFISYIGHSGTQTWDNGIGDPAQLQNDVGRFALITDFGCSTGKFAEPNINAFGELFTLGPSASAIGYVGNSALGFTSIAQSLPQIFYRKFLRDTVFQIGRAHLLAKLERAGDLYGGYSNLVNQVMMLTNTLIGDPIISLAIPAKPDLHVSGQDVEIDPPIPTDDNEVASIRIPFSNHGSAPSDSIDIRWSWNTGDRRVDSVLTRILPGFKDTLSIQLPTRDLAGEHRLFVRFNDGGRISESDTSDNTLTLTWNVLSTAFRLLHPAPGFGGPPGALVFLNPATASADTSGLVRLELDTVDSDRPAITLANPLGQVATTFDGSSLEQGRRYFWRIQQERSGRIPSEGMLYISNVGEDGWSVGSGSDWPDCVLLNADAPDADGLRIVEDTIALRVTSSGFYDGGFGAIEINSKNIVPNTFFWGHTVAVIDTNAFEVDTVRQFAVWNTAQSISDSLASFLTSVPSGKFVIHIVITDGQQGLNANARNVIRSLGSRFIDSLAFRDSWAMLFVKGESPSHAREFWHKTFTGKIIVDSSIARPSRSGSFLSSWIGPARQWTGIVTSADLPDGSRIALTLTGKRSSGIVDTIATAEYPSLFDLSSISATTHPFLRIGGQLEHGTAGRSPRVRSIRVNGTPAGELALNYQSVQVNADTLLEGNPLSYSAGVWYTGLPISDSVRMSVSWIGNGGSATMFHHVAPVNEQTGIHTFRGEIPTAGLQGKTTIQFALDPTHVYTELYETNNVFVRQFVVSKDTIVPALEYTVDDRALYDGDYVATRPTIQVIVRDNSPLRLIDPSSIDILIDGRRIMLGTHPDSLFEAGTDAVLARATVRPVLDDGAHTLAIRIRDATGNEGEAIGPVRFFSDSDLKLMHAFAFPNPFSEQTVVSFVLTGSEVPDQLILRLYSVAGRLLWKREVGRGELSVGLNKVIWDGRDSDGDHVANGLYLLRIEARTASQSASTTTKLVRMR